MMVCIINIEHYLKAKTNNLNIFTGMFFSDTKQGGDLFPAGLAPSRPEIDDQDLATPLRHRLQTAVRIRELQRQQRVNALADGRSFFTAPPQCKTAGGGGERAPGDQPVAACAADGVVGHARSAIRFRTAATLARTGS